MAWQQDPHSMDPHTPNHPRLTDPWRAGCRETGTSGSEERHGETTRRNPDTAPHADSYDVPGWDFQLDEDTGELTITTPTGRRHTTKPEPIIKPVGKTDESIKDSDEGWEPPF